MRQMKKLEIIPYNLIILKRKIKLGSGGGEGLNCSQKITESAFLRLIQNFSRL